MSPDEKPQLGTPPKMQPDDATVIVCDGLSGWRVASDKYCHWCMEKRRMLWSYVHGGYSGIDYFCGTCGSYVSVEDYVRFHKISESDRDEHIVTVAARPDPKCFECQDSGDRAMPLSDEPEFCVCAAGTVLRGRG